MGYHLEHEERARLHHLGVRAAITWLHAHAATMNDPHARSVLNSAAWALGQDKLEPERAADQGANPTQPAPKERES